MAADQKYKIVLLGSLPPVPSNTSLWTELLADTLQEAGVEVVVLIDSLAPPPNPGSGIKTARPYDEDVKTGMYDNWPRLAIVGNMADSLPVLSQLANNATAVMVTDQTMFDIALIKTNLEQAWGKLRQWLGEQLGSAGNKLASAIIDHKRLSTEIGTEVRAFDFVLSGHEVGLALTDSQMADFGAACSSVRLVPSLLGPPTASSNTTNKCLVIGMPQTMQVDFQSICRLPSDTSVAFEDRYSSTVIPAIQQSDVVAVLGGHKTALCPLVIRALNAGKKLIVADQHWVKNLPAGSVLPVAGGSIAHGLAHALQFATTSSAYRDTAYPAEGTLPNVKTDFAASVCEAVEGISNGPLWSDTLSFTCSTGIDTLPVENEPTGIWALVGAIPMRPILQQSYPALDLENCPRFLSLDHARYLADLTATPLVSVAANLGYEDALLSDPSNMPGDPAKMDDQISLKVKPWQAVMPHLIEAHKALAFGCAVEGAHRPKAASHTDSAVWRYMFPEGLETEADLSQQLDEDTGLYWQFNQYQNAISLLFTTGATGTLQIDMLTPHSLVMSDGAKTVVAEKSQAIDIEVPPHGMALLKITSLPNSDGRLTDIRKTLAGVPVNLKWFPHA